MAASKLRTRAQWAVAALAATLATWGAIRFVDARSWQPLPQGGKVRWTGSKSERYPFTDADISWLGAVPLPGANEARIIALPPESNAAKTHFFAVTGPGRYRIEHRKVTVVTDPVPPPGQRGEPIHTVSAQAVTGNREDDVADIDASELVLVRIEGLGDNQGPWHEPPMLFMRDDSGRRVALKISQRSGGGVLLLRPTLANDVHGLQLGLVEVRELSTEFFIHAPHPPAEKNAVPPTQQPPSLP